MQKKREATMADVAEIAGVAKSTVSRALTDPDKISKKTVAKVLAAAESVGYTPNMMARNFRKGQTTSILIVLPEFLQAGVSDVISQLLQNVNRCLMDHGYNLMIANLGNSQLSQKHILDLAFGGTIRGAVMLSPVVPEDGSRSLLQANFPMVSTLFDLSRYGIPSVVADERNVMKRVTQDHYHRGFRHFFYISGPDDSYQEMERFGGVADAVAEVGLDKSALVKSGGHLSYQEGFEVGKQAAEQYLRDEKKNTLVLSSSDDMALSFMRTLQEAGKRIPQDLSIVSFNDSPVCEWLQPSLSSIAFPYQSIAENAVNILLKLFDDKTADVPVRTVLANTFHERDSSKGI